eukprot:jgi/Botrbrau1/11237/Bobra.0038s0009.1
MSVPHGSHTNPTCFLGSLLDVPDHSHINPTSFPYQSHIDPTQSVPDRSHKSPTSIPQILSHIIPRSIPPKSHIDVGSEIPVPESYTLVTQSHIDPKFNPTLIPHRSQIFRVQSHIYPTLWDRFGIDVGLLAAGGINVGQFRSPSEGLKGRH